MDVSFKIITSSEKDQFETMVINHLNSDFKLHGPTQIIIQGGEIRYYQAVIYGKELGGVGE